MQGRLRITGRLGEGGMGTVYEAFDIETQTTIAVKKLRWDSPEGLQRFKSEFRSLQNLEHRNLIQLGELFEESGCWFFTMELIKGQNIIEYVRASTTPIDSPVSHVSVDKQISLLPPSLASSPQLEPKTP